MKKGITKLEKSWILYDVGNSAFILMVSTLIPIYFNSLSESAGLSSAQYLAYWGYAASAATLIVAFIGPVFGTLADTKNFKKPLFLAFLLLGAVGCMTLGLYSSWIVFLIVYVIAKIGYSASLVFYDAMLNDVTEEERVDKVSALGFGWGYIGSCIPFVLCLILILGSSSFGLEYKTSMILAFGIVGLWWLITSIPLLKNYRQKNYVEYRPHVIHNSFKRLGITLKDIRKEKKIFLFLLAYFFYIDGVYTIIEMATAYGQSLGLDSTGLLLALLVTQIIAFPATLIFGRLTERIEAEKLI
ncbi:MAG: MFS transporter, partial [Lachnospiraceae bacterium]